MIINIGTDLSSPYYTKKIFSGGEVHVVLTEEYHKQKPYESGSINFKVRLASSEDLMTLLLVHDAVSRTFVYRDKPSMILTMPYIPYALARYKATLERLAEMGYAASNLVIGVGGILRNNSRDTLGFASKEIYIERNGVGMDLEKDPITDSGKKSHKGRVALIKENGQYRTVDQCDDETLSKCLLNPVFIDGSCITPETFSNVKLTIQKHR